MWVTGIKASLGSSIGKKNMSESKETNETMRDDFLDIFDIVTTISPVTHHACKSGDFCVDDHSSAYSTCLKSTCRALH